MKRFLAIFLVLFTVARAQIQLDTSNILPKKLISVDFLSVGSSFPYGSFSKRIKSSENSGFANTGLKLDFGFNYQVYKNLGVKSMLVFQNHKIDDYKYKKDIYSENALNQYSITTGSWTNISGLFGAYAIFNLDENLSLQPKILLGFNYGTSPYINLLVEDTSNVVMKIKQEKASALSFCYLLGLDATISLVKKYYLIIGIDSFNADMFFDKVQVKNQTYGIASEFKFKQPIQTISFKMGFGKTFG